MDLDQLLLFIWILICNLGISELKRLPSTIPKCRNSIINNNTNEINIPAKLSSTKNETLFWLMEYNLDCDYIKTSLNGRENVDDDGTILDEEEDGSTGVFDPSGVLILDGGNYMQNEYCIQSIHNEEYTINVCQVSCGNGENDRICVPKCCGWNKVLHIYGEGNVTCVPLDDPESRPLWRPNVYKKDSGIQCLESGDRSTNCIHSNIHPDKFHYQNLFGGCEDEENYTLDVIKFEEIPFGFTKDGLLLIHTFELEANTFCIDSATSAEPGSIEPHSALVCVPMCHDDKYAKEKEQIGLYYICTMFISAFFLFLTVLVYIIIWEKHNVHGWTVFSLSISMLLMLLLLGSARLMSKLGRQELSRKFKCIFVGVLAHYFFLTTFSLLTCLSFDLWCTFRTLAPSIGKSKGILRFKIYLLFSLGLPFIIVSTGIIMDRIYDNENVVRHKMSGPIIPQYGVETCYIADKYAQGLYIFIPVAILLLANFGFFLATMFIMYEYHKNTQAARRNCAKQKQTFQLFAKLFFVMGVTWTVEVIEYISVYNRNDYDKNNCRIYHAPGKAWIFTDLLNICQGIAIFLIFVCKKQVMVQLSRKSSTLRGKFSRKESNPNNPTSSINKRDINTLKSNQTDTLNTTTLTETNL